MGQANTFKTMLDTFRHDNPADTLFGGDIDEPTTPFDDLNDINKAYLLEDRDKLMEFIQNVNFSDTLDS